VGGPQLIQPGADDLPAHEGARGDDQHGRIGQPQPLGGDHRAKVDLVAHQQVGLPACPTRTCGGTFDVGVVGRGDGQRQDGGGPLPGQPAGEALGQVSVLPVEVQLEQRQPPRRMAEGDAARIEGREPGRLYRREHRRLPAKSNRMPAFSAARAMGTSGSKWPLPRRR